MLAAAQAKLQAGTFDAALELLAAAEAGPLDELGRARADLLQAEIAYAQNRGGDAPPLLLRAAQTLESLDARLARDTYLDAWGAALFAGRLARAGTLREVSRAVARPRPTDGPPSGRRPAARRLRPACSPRDALPRHRCCTARRPRSPATEVSVEEVLRWGWLATAAAVYLWDFDTCLAVATRGGRARSQLGRARGPRRECQRPHQVVALSGDFATRGRS